MLIDAHVHLPSLGGWSGHDDFFGGAVEAVAYLRDECGTDGAIFNTWQGVLGRTEEDLDTANADALEMTREYSGFLLPGAVLHPAFPEASVRWLERFRKEGMLWVGELVGYANPFKYTDAVFIELCAVCAEHGHILQLHCEAEIVPLARRFPSLKIVCSHINVGLCAELAAQPNIWLDISGGAGGLCLGAIETAYACFGPERLLYGTDFTGYEPRCFQQRLGWTVSGPEHRRAIESGNVMRLLASAGMKWPVG